VWEQLAAVFQTGDRILELGCGTGTDALWLAQQGMDVLATDASSQMLQAAAQKLRTNGVREQVALHILDLQHPTLPAGLPNKPSFDGALANFGVLNCLADRRPLARALGRWLRPGGRLVLVVMGPFCLWEVAWHLLHGQVRTALRRFRSGIPAHIGNDTLVRVWYPSPHRLRAEFTSFFRCLKMVGIGALLPPSYLDHLVERWPALFRKLADWERRWGDRFPWTWLNDHYLMILERQ
jgi:SAM-dependent methyltransferase